MYFVEAHTLTEAYHLALLKLKEQGRVIESGAWGTRRLEIPLCVTVTKPLHNPYISKVIPCGPVELTAYISEICDGTLDWAIEAGKEKYTYHDRFVSQLSAVVNELRQDPSSTRAVIPILRQGRVRARRNGRSSLSSSPHGER